MHNKIFNIIKITTIITLLFSLIACGDNNVEIDDNKEIFNEEIYEQEIIPAIEYLKACDSETFTVRYDVDNPLIAGYLESDPKKIATLVPREEGLTEGYISDEADANYYLVSNFNNLDELKNELNKYLSSDFINNTMINFDFIEFEDQLYLVRGPRGYGTQYLDIDTLKEDSVSEDELTRYYVVDYFQYNNFEHKSLLEFKYIDGHWKLNSSKIVEE